VLEGPSATNLLYYFLESDELHKIAFPNVLHTRFFLILTKKKFLQTLNEVMNFINNKLLLC
jgi:hypothetical protein